MCGRDSGTGLGSRAEYEEFSGLFRPLQEVVHASWQLASLNV